MKKPIHKLESTQIPLQDLPVWFQPQAPLGSLVRDLAACSGRIVRVSCFTKKRGKWVSGPELKGAVLEGPLALEVIERIDAKFEIEADGETPLPDDVRVRLNRCVSEWVELKERGLA